MNQDNTENKTSNSKLIQVLLKKLFWHKYFLISFLFLVWMIFFDTNSILTHYELQKQINKYQSEKNALEKKIEESETKYTSLKNDKEARERYARENYFMKKDNENIIIVTYEQDSLKKQN